MKSTVKTLHAEPVELDQEALAQFAQVATIRDKLGFSARIAAIVEKEVDRVLRQHQVLPETMTSVPSFRAEKRWQPSSNELQRGRAQLLKEFRKAHNLAVVQFAELAGKSRQQIYKDIEMRRLLALSVGARGQHVPDWQLDPIKKNLTVALLDKARDVDAWTLYAALSDKNAALADKSPIDAVTPRNIERVRDILLNQLGIHT